MIPHNVPVRSRSITNRPVTSLSEGIASVEEQMTTTKRTQS